MSRASLRLAGVCVAGVAMSLASASSPGLARGLPREVGTVETIAGPGFCRTPATLDPASAEVRASALSDRLLYLETGPPGDGLFAVVDTRGVRPEGEGETLDPRELVRLEDLGPDGWTPPGAGFEIEGASPARLAPGAGGGVLVVRGQTILHVTPKSLIEGAEGDGFAIEVVAGDPEAAPGGPSGGDRGPAAEATFRQVRAIATDQAGNLYVADEVDDDTLAVRVVNRTAAAVTFYPGTPGELTVAPGAIDTIALDPGAFGEGANPTISGAPEADPVALAVMGERLYLARTAPTSAAPGGGPTSQVVLLNLGGQAVTLHGATIAPGAAETVVAPGSPVPLGGPGGGNPGVGEVPAMAPDTAGNLRLVDQTRHRVVTLDPAGALTTLAGTGEAGFNGNLRPADEAMIDTPTDIEISPDEQRLYLVDRGNAELRFVDAAGIIHAGLGNGAGLTWRCRDGAIAPRSELGSAGAGLSHLVDDGRDSVYLSLRSYNQVLRLDPSAALDPVIGVMPAGRVCGDDPACSPIGDGGPAGEALVNVGAAAVRPDGGLYVVDAGHGVRLANLGPDPLVAHGLTIAPGSIETVVVGDGDPGDPGSVASLELSFSPELAADAKGNLYISERGGSESDDDDEEGGVDPGVYVLGPDGAVTTLAGPIADPETGCCASPGAMTIDGDGDLYVVDERVWFFNRGSAAAPAHGQSVDPGAMAPVTGIEGDLVTGEDGPALEADLGQEVAAAADAQGNLYLGSGNEVRRIDPAGILTTVVGTGADGFNGDGQVGRLTTLYGVSDLAVDRCGNLLIADTQNERVRRWNVVGPCAAPSATVGDTRGGLSGSSQRLLVAGGAILGAGLVALVWWFRRRVRPA